MHYNFDSEKNFNQIVDCYFEMIRKISRFGLLKVFALHCIESTSSNGIA